MKTKKLSQVTSLLIALMLTFTFMPTVAAARETRYVKQNGTGDGSTWANASNNLQAMINASASGDQIFIAAWIYKPIYTITG